MEERISEIKETRRKLKLIKKKGIPFGETKQQIRISKGKRKRYKNKQCKKNKG
jgi:hypothetical protein